jgi:hypothetical protein
MERYAALVMSLPTRNSTLRMRLWRALKESGCGVLRDGVYLLPRSDARYEALSWMEAEIRSWGGFAMTLEVEPRTDAQLAAVRALFDRSSEYGALVRRFGVARASLARLGPRRAHTEVRRLEHALQKLAAIDFYPGEASTQAAAAARGLGAAYRALYAGGEPRSSRRRLRRVDAAQYQNRIWATRKTPWVDRLASAWLIKRFIDRGAKFVWIARPSECPKHAVGFDFDGAEFTHAGNRVTFEVLLARFGLDIDPTLMSIAAAVHFLDVGGIPVPDAKGLETMLKGARETARNDDALVADSMRTFDLLYSGYRSG